jgi:hypothetical protein
VAHHEPLASSLPIDAMIGNFFITLAQIALTFAMILLWFFG